MEDRKLFVDLLNAVRDAATEEAGSVSMESVHDERDEAERDQWGVPVVIRGRAYDAYTYLMFILVIYRTKSCMYCDITRLLPLSLPLGAQGLPHLTLKLPWDATVPVLL